MGRSLTKTQIKSRTLDIASLYAQGWSASEISQHMQIGKRIVDRAITEVEYGYQKEYAADIGRMKNTIAIGHQKIMKEAWLAHQSKPHHGYLREINRSLTRLAQLYGLDAPKQIEIDGEIQHTVKTEDQLTDGQLSSIAGGDAEVDERGRLLLGSVLVAQAPPGSDRTH